MNMTPEDFLAQKRIAVAGVSCRTGTDVPANRIYRRLKFTGHDVFAVNPNAATFDGDPCYPRVRSIPDGVDGVVIVTRPDTTEAIVRECDAPVFAPSGCIDPLAATARASRRRPSITAGSTASTSSPTAVR